MSSKKNNIFSNGRKLKLSFLIAISLASFSVSGALPQIHGGELLHSCQLLHQDYSSAESLACAVYISGFLDGALVTDQNNASELKQAERSGFMERALRTRLGDRGSDYSYLHFCVPESKTKIEIIEQLAPYLTDKVNVAVTLKKTIYQGLKAEFPCTTSF